MSTPDGDRDYQLFGVEAISFRAPLGPGLPLSHLRCTILYRCRWLQLVFYEPGYGWSTLGIRYDLAHSLSHIWQRPRFSVALPLGIKCPGLPRCGGKGLELPYLRFECIPAVRRTARAGATPGVGLQPRGARFRPRWLRPVSFTLVGSGSDAREGRQLSLREQRVAGRPWAGVRPARPKGSQKHSHFLSGSALSSERVEACGAQSDLSCGPPAEEVFGPHNSASRRSSANSPPFSVGFGLSPIPPRRSAPGRRGRRFEEPRYSLSAQSPVNGSAHPIPKAQPHSRPSAAGKPQSVFPPEEQAQPKARSKARSSSLPRVRLTAAPLSLRRVFARLARFIYIRLPPK